MANGYFDNVYINNGDKGNVGDCGVLKFEEDDHTPYWLILKRGSTYTPASPQNDCLLFTYWDGSYWHELLKLDPNNDYAGLKSIQIKHNAPQLPLYDPVLPTHLDAGNGNIVFEDTTPEDPPNRTYPEGQKASLYQIMVADPINPTVYGPAIATDFGFWVEKDINTYGALFTSTDPAKPSGGGAIMFGHGFRGPETPPVVVLPGTSFINIVSHSENFGHNYWAKYPTSGDKTNKIVNNSQDTDFKAPDEKNSPPPYSAWKIICSEDCTGVESTPIALDNTKKFKIVSVWLKGTTAGQVITVELDGLGDEQFTLTTDWKRYHVFIETESTASKAIRFYNTSTSGTYYAWGAQFTEGMTHFYWGYTSTTNGPSAPFDTLHIQNVDLTYGNIKCADIEANGNIDCSDTLIAPQIRFSPSGSPVLSSDSGYLKIDGISGNVKITTGTYTYFISTAPYMFNNDITINGGNLNCTGDIDCSGTLKVNDEIQLWGGNWYPRLSGFYGSLRIQSSEKTLRIHPKTSAVEFIAGVPFDFDDDVSVSGDISCSGDVDCSGYIHCSGGATFGNHIYPDGYPLTIGHYYFPWGASAIVEMWYKDLYAYLCAPELSDQVAERKFKTVDDAISLIKHETSKEVHHMKYGEKEGTIVCTCGKEVDLSKGETVCPEHKEAWNDRYAIKTGDLIEASAQVIPHLLERIEELEKKLNKQT